MIDERAAEKDGEKAKERGKASLRPLWRLEGGCSYSGTVLYV